MRYDVRVVEWDHRFKGEQFPVSVKRHLAAGYEFVAAIANVHATCIVLRKRIRWWQRKPRIPAADAGFAVKKG